MKKNMKQWLMLALLASPIYGNAETEITMTDASYLQTDLLRPSIGHVGEVIGVEVNSIQSNELGHTHLVLSIPETVKDVQSLAVLDAHGKKVKSYKKYEFSKTPDGQPNGLTIYFEKPRKHPFRLRINAAPE